MKLVDTEGRSADTRLTGPWLIIAHTAWLVLVIPSLGFFIVSLFVIYQQNKSGAIPAPGSQQLSAIGLSLGGFAVLNTIVNLITSAIWYGVGFFIFWRRSDDWLALLAAFVLVMFNVTNNSNNNVPSALATVYPALSLPLYILNFLGSASLGVFFLLFPGGWLAPRWMWLMLLFSLISQFLGDWSEPLLPDTGESQLPAQSGQSKYTATLANVKPSCSYLAMLLTLASLRGFCWVGLIERQKTAGFCSR